MAKKISEIPQSNEDAWILRVTNKFERAKPHYPEARSNSSVCIDPYYACCGGTEDKGSHYECNRGEHGIRLRILPNPPVAKAEPIPLYKKLRLNNAKD